MMMSRKLSLTISIVAISILFVACSPSPQIPDDSSVSSSYPDSAILRRARVWVDNKVPYGSFDDNHDNDYYNGYRADCSGFVSYAWALTTPGLNTGGLLNSNAALQIQISELSPGDILNNGRSDRNGHVVLFVRWKDEKDHVFIAYDESSYPGYASEKTYTLIPILNSGQWTIKEIDGFAAGPYYAQHLISSEDLPYAGVPPTPGRFPINRAFSTQTGWRVMLDSIEVLPNYTLKINYSWNNISTGPLSLVCREGIRIYAQLADGTILEESNSNCASTESWDVGSNQTYSGSTILEALGDSSQTFSVIYESVGRVDGIRLNR